MTTNRTMLIALAGLAVGTGAAMMMMPRTRKAIASQGRLALGYAGDYANEYAGDYLPAAARSRKKTTRAASKRKYVRRGRKTARA